MSQLKVTIPRTTNGTMPHMIGGQQQYKVKFLPLEAKKDLESISRKLPEPLQYKIEIVDSPEPVIAPATSALTPDIQALINAAVKEALSTQSESPAPVKQTPKPKTNEKD